MFLLDLVWPCCKFFPAGKFSKRAKLYINYCFSSFNFKLYIYYNEQWKNNNKVGELFIGKWTKLLHVYFKLKFKIFLWLKMNGILQNPHIKIVHPIFCSYFLWMFVSL